MEVVYIGHEDYNSNSSLTLNKVYYVMKEYMSAYYLINDEGNYQGYVSEMFIRLDILREDKLNNLL